MVIVPEFDAVREYEVVGEYPPIKGLEINGMEYFPSTPQYNRPISPRENFHRQFDGRQVIGWLKLVGPCATSTSSVRVSIPTTWQTINASMAAVDPITPDLAMRLSVGLACP